MLARSLRECLTNILKHSGAKNCLVTKEYTNGMYQIRIEDDGVGFIDTETNGNGLTSIQERMRLLHGYANIADAQTGGASVTLSVPVKEQERMGLQ